MSILKHNFSQLLISIDQVLNVLFSMLFRHKEKAWADESLSSHAYCIFLQTGGTFPMKLLGQRAKRVLNGVTQYEELVIAS
jgi:hypothetical protein